MVEGMHPYSIGVENYAIKFEGATSIQVYFDCRTTLGDGAKLVLKGGGVEVTLESSGVRMSLRCEARCL
jgi:hypothetical protein